MTFNAKAFDRVVEALENHGGTVKSTGQEKAQAQCPAHDDGSPSLSITGIEGRVLIHCHAGCDTRDILAAAELGMGDLYDNGSGAEYKYIDGRIVVRRWNQAKGKKEFVQKGLTKALPSGTFLFRLNEVIEAVKNGVPVYVVEGEQDVLALESLGVVATTNPMGASNWHKVNHEPLHGGVVRVIADQDEPGRKWAAKVVDSLSAHCTIELLAPKSGKDAADHVAAGFGVDDLVHVLKDVPSRSPRSASDRDVQGTEISEKKSAATVLVEMAQDAYSFGVSTDGEPFAVPLTAEPVARLLRGGKQGLRSELARNYFVQTGKAAPQQALADALLVIDGIATMAEPEPLPQRVAASPGEQWIDLGDPSGDAIRIRPAGWDVTSPPVRFRRTVLTAQLPRPVQNGSLDELWQLLNVAPADRPLVAAWLVASLIADIPHPILNLAGEQGTGKSTAARMLLGLVDPSPVPLRKAPRDADSWVTAATGSWMVAIDNISVIPDWLSDTLCRAVTGDGDVRRQLYTDGGLALFAFRRCIILNGIDLGAVRGDLADRLLVVDLDVIPEDGRRLDRDLEERWQDAQPRIIGALLDLAASVASVASANPYVRLERSPRMADFALILSAVDQTLGTHGLDRYVDRARRLAADALTADPFVTEITRQLGDTPFIGTSAELLATIVLEERAPKDWPRNARQLTTLLKRQAPVMRRAGWDVHEMPAGHDNALRWTVSRPEIARIGRSQDSQRSQLASDASVASHEYGPTKDDQAVRRSFYEAFDATDCLECTRRAVFNSGPCPMHRAAS